MADSLIRFCSFQDSDFILEPDTQNRQSQSVMQDEGFTFTMNFLRLKWIQSISIGSIPQLILQRSASLEYYRVQPSEIVSLKSQRSGCHRPNLQPQKLKRLTGNKLERQTPEPPYLKQINQLKDQIVSSFTRIEQELDKSINEQLPKELKKSHNRSISKSTDKSFSSVQNKASMKSSIVLSSRTPRSSAKSSIVNSQKKSASKQSRVWPTHQQKENQLQPVTVRVSLKKFSQFPPSNSILVKEPRYQIAHKQPGAKPKLTK